MMRLFKLNIKERDSTFHCIINVRMVHKKKVSFLYDSDWYAAKSARLNQSDFVTKYCVRYDCTCLRVENMFMVFIDFSQTVAFSQKTGEPSSETPLQRKEGMKSRPQPRFSCMQFSLLFSSWTFSLSRRSLWVM